MERTSPGATDHCSKDGNAPPPSIACALWQDGYIYFLKPVCQGVVVSNIPPASCDAATDGIQPVPFQRDQLNLCSQLGPAVELRDNSCQKNTNVVHQRLRIVVTCFIIFTGDQSFNCPHLEEHDVVAMSIVTGMWDGSDCTQLLLRRLISCQGISSKHNRVWPGKQKQEKM